MSSTSGSTEARWTSQMWGVLIVLAGAIFLDSLDLSSVGVALPSIQSDLGMSNSSLQWVISGYVLGYGGFLLLGGRSADLLGRRRVFILSLAVFAVASLLGGLVNDGTLLVLVRFIKGVSAGFTTPAGLAIVVATFAEGPARNKALSIYAATGAAGFSLGLVFGGLVTQLGWRWTFILPMPMALAVLAGGIMLIRPDEHSATGRRRYDVAGAVAVTAAMLLLVYTLVEAPHFGWGSSRTILSFVGVVVLLGVFVAIERSVASPLVRLGILRSRTLVVALVGAMSIYGAYVGWQFITTLYTQQILHWSPLQMALSILPGGLLVAFGAPNTFKLVMRFGLTPVILAGFLSFSIGYALFLRIGPDANYFGSILAPNLLIGLGFALSVPGVNIRIFTGIPMHEQGLASGLLNAGFQVGSAVGLAVVVAVIAAGGGDGGNATTTLHSYYPAIGVTIGIAALGLLASFFGAPRAQPAAAPQSEASMATVEG